jgi:hypothetical protein
MLFKPIALEGGNDNPAEGMAITQPKVYAEAQDPCPWLGVSPPKAISEKPSRSLH